MKRSLYGAGLLCGLGLGTMIVSGGCGGPPATGTQIVEDAKAKEVAQDRAGKMKEYLAKKAQTEKPHSRR
jgi:hypothetical protein